MNDNVIPMGRLEIRTADGVDRRLVRHEAAPEAVLAARLVGLVRYFPPQLAITPEDEAVEFLASLTEEEP